MKLKEREITILDAIVREYIESAAPVSSTQVQARIESDLSSATIRSIMSVLDELRFLSQPYTSAGRVPTQKAYRFFVNYLIDTESNNTAGRKTKINLHDIFHSDPWEELWYVTEHIANRLGMAVLSVCDTGSGPTFRSTSSELFKQPEFREGGFVTKFSKIFDLDRDDISIYSKISKEEDLSVFIGRENPVVYTRIASSFVLKKELPQIGICSILVFGPMRVDYEYVNSFLTHLYV